MSARSFASRASRGALPSEPPAFPSFHVKPDAPHLRETEEHVLALQRGELAFDDALREVVRYQRRYLPTLAEFWHARGFSPGSSAPSALELPPVPTDVFKHVSLSSTEAPPTRTFRTSGTTLGTRGQAPRISTRAYDHGARLHAKRCLQLCERERRWISLVPAANDAPDSSLSHMVTDLANHFSAQPPLFAAGDNGLDVDAARDAIAQARDALLVFGTSLAFHALLDRPLPLPEGSLVVDTGGFKGRSVELSPADHHARLCRDFERPARAVLSEYSMTELSSQLYTDSLLRADGGFARRRLLAPPWCRVIIRDPATLEPLPDGQRGLVSLVDLANVDVPCAILTSDLGSLDVHGLALHGRTPGATPRGCSMATEELLALQQRNAP